MDFLEYKQYLAHYGIKGQRHGVRRFQNEDGTLTAAGERRYYTATGPRTSSNKYGGLVNASKTSYQAKQRGKYYSSISPKASAAKNKSIVDASNQKRKSNYRSIPSKGIEDHERSVGRIASEGGNTGANKAGAHASKTQLQNDRAYKYKVEETDAFKDAFRKTRSMKAGRKAYGEYAKDKNNKEIARRTSKNKIKNAKDKVVYDTKKSVKKAANSAKDKVSKGKARIMKLFSK